MFFSEGAASRIWHLTENPNKPKSHSSPSWDRSKRNPAQKWESSSTCLEAYGSFWSVLTKPFFLPNQENQNPLLDLSAPLFLFLHHQLRTFPLWRAQLQRRCWRRAPITSPPHRVRLPLLLPPPSPQPQLHPPLSAPNPHRRLRLCQRVSLVLSPAKGPQRRRESLLQSLVGVNCRVRVRHGSGAGITALRWHRQIRLKSYLLHIN